LRYPQQALISSTSGLPIAPFIAQSSVTPLEKYYGVQTAASKFTIAKPSEWEGDKKPKRYDTGSISLTFH
jgi:hypothetical protein